MSTITGGELLVRCLAVEGIRFVFGLPCPEVDPILAQLDAHGMRFVPVRHEAAGVHMAEGLYKTTGQVAAVLGNPGPGSANLLPGVITARHEGVPVLVVTAQHRLGTVYPSPPSTFQGQDQLDVFRPAVKWGGPIFAWERIAEVVRMAFREMWIGRPGPVHVEIPAPVLYATGDPSTTAILPPERYRPPSPQPSEAHLHAAADLLAAAARPVVVSGAGVDRGEANEALVRLVRILGCPVVTTMAGRSTVPFDHPNHLYGYGPGADAARQEADVILVAGSRMGNLDLPFDKYWGDPARAKLVQIDVDARNMGVTRPLTLGIVADVKTTLAALADRLEGRGHRPRGGEDLARYRELGRAWWDRQVERVASWNGPGIHPADAMRAVGRAFGPDAVYVTDGGNTSLWAHWFLPPTQPRSYHSILELGMLGTGIPSAIGAKLAAPSREVVCVTGDGAAGFNFMEMQSAAREGLKITTVVFAEGSWTMEEPNERLLYGRTFGTAMGSVRWDRVAEGLGCDGIHVDQRAALDPALERAKRSDAPTVVCVRTDRDANLAVPEDLLMRFIEVYQGPIPGPG
ncbi:MAG: thiamine pyrophosphate-binding protein [Candidatus Binatia bacterium]